MKRFSSILIVLLLASIVSMVQTGVVEAASTKLYVNPASIIDSSLQPIAPTTIKPIADGTFKGPSSGWTRNTTTIRPNLDGTYSDWTGRILTLNPNGHGASSQWSSWVHITPNSDGKYTNWTNSFSYWDDWPTHDGDISVVSTSINNYNESSNLWEPPLEPRALNIIKVRLTVVAKNTVGTSDEKMRLMLVVGGNMQNGSLVTPGGSYTTYYYEWATNPATSLSWTWPDMDTLQGGVRSQQVGATFDGALTVTQLYVSILTGGVYTHWDDWPTNNTNTDYVFAAGDALLQTSALTNSTSEAWTISKVRAVIIARANMTTDDEIAIVLAVGAQQSQGTSFTPSTYIDYTEYSYESATKPGGGAWTWPDIDALQAGVKTIQVKGSWAGEFRVTQLFVQVIESGTYQHWADTTPDGDVTYNSAISGGKVRISQLQDSALTWSIARVQVSIVARTNIPIPSDEKIGITLYIDGKLLNSSNFTPTTNYQTFSYVWAKNPRYTNYAWNWSAINAMQAGVRSVKTPAGVLWKGELRVTQLYVVVCQQGTYQDYDDWPNNNGDTDYVSANMKDMKQSSHLEIPVHPAWDISRVRVVIYARATEVTDEQVSPMVVIGGIEYPGIGYSPTTSYAKYTADWGKNPDTGSHWTWSDIDTLEAGVMSATGNDKIWTGELRVTQMYVEISCLNFKVDVVVENVIDLYTVDFRLNYTTAVLTPTAITNGSFWNGPNLPNIWIEDINDTTGSLRYMISWPLGTLQGKDATGPETVAIIDFTIDSYGGTVLDMCRTELDNSTAGLITHDAYDGYFKNIGRGDANADHLVNSLDIGKLNAHWSPASGTPPWSLGYNRNVDCNDDGYINSLDIGVVNANWGKAYP